MTRERDRTPDWLIGGGEVGDLIRSIDWSATPLGTRETWPQSLRVAVNLLVASSFPMAILWGRDLNLLYNDAYRVIAAGRHPAGLGRPTRDVWPGVWDFVKPLLEKVMASGEAVHLEDQVFRIDRHGQMEDA